MKSILLSAFVALVAVPAARANDEVLKRAQEAYAQREYNASGIQKAQEAADLYGQLLGSTRDAKAQAKLSVAQAEALYFVGNASESKSTKIEKHLKGMQAAEAGVRFFGITDVEKVDDYEAERLKATLPAEDLALLAEALYQRGINLGQWGQANGVMESLSKWPELRATMELIVKLGKKDIHEYGPYRTLGRGYFKIPALLGGSLSKADRYLSMAIKSTKAQGQNYSINGFNNTFHAEVLKEMKKEQDARALLQAFLAADATTLNPANVPENKQAQKEAAELLKSW